MHITTDSRTVRLCLTPLALAIGACKDTTAPASAAGLTLETQASHSEANVGVPAQLSYTLRNVSDAPRIIVFTGCGVLPYIETRGGSTIHPPHGVWVCAAEISRVTLAPGEAIVSTEFVAGGAPMANDGSTVFLPAGVYRAFAEADFHLGAPDGPHVELRSRSVLFRIRR